MKKIVFFLRHNNDLDHITPIIYKWILTKNIATDIIITTKKSLLNDYRIKFLKETSKGRSDINFYHITDLLTTRQKWNYKLYQFYTKYYKVKQFTKIDNVMEKLVDTFMEKYFVNWANCVFCFDWNSELFTKLICANAKSKCFTTVALPHGDRPYWNKIQRRDDINYAQVIIPYIERQFFGYIVVPNKICVKHYEMLVDDEQIKILGSTRYCDEWLNIHNTIKPPKPYFDGEEKKLKVLMFLRNQHFPINWQEVAVAIKLITQFKEVFLVVRNHPRGSMTYDLLNNHPDLMDKENLKVVNDINSSSLVDWADLILDVGVSICWEPIKQNKPVLMLDYLQSNELTISHYMPKIAIRCPDDLLENIRKFYKNKQRKIYNEKQRQKFLKEVIMDDGKVLERYCNFLEEQFNIKKV